jgi:hypothetical protein
VPKQDLMARMCLAVDSGELRVAAALEDADALLDEMRAMKISVGPTSREKFGATAAGTHDDLVLAVALGNWWVGRMKRQEAGGVTDRYFYAAAFCPDLSRILCKHSSVNYLSAPAGSQQG